MDNMDKVRGGKVHCLLVSDEQDELEQTLIDDLEFFKKHRTTFGYKSVKIERIVDSVHFVQSKNNHLMQLTDVMCYIIKKAIEAKENIELANQGQLYFYNKCKLLSSKVVFDKYFPW
jgi:hypothetical protein